MWVPFIRVQLLCRQQVPDVLFTEGTPAFSALFLCHLFGLMIMFQCNQEPARYFICAQFETELFARRFGKIVWIFWAQFQKQHCTHGDPNGSTTGFSVSHQSALNSTNHYRSDTYHDYNHHHPKRVGREGTKLFFSLDYNQDQRGALRLSLTPNEGQNPKSMGLQS